MNTTSKFRLNTILAILVLLFATAGNAWGEPISIRYAGTGFDTTFDNLDDGFPVNLSLADAKGTFGASKVEVAAEFMTPEGDIDCNEGYDVKFGVNYAATVITFERMDQLFGFSWLGGWMCLNTDTGHHYGYVEGEFTGGTGRFHGATGTWSTDFEGYNLEPPFLVPIRAGFRSFSGTISGDVVLQ